MRNRENPLVKVKLPDGSTATMFKNEAIRAGLLESDDKELDMKVETKERKPSKKKNEVED